MRLLTAVVVALLPSAAQAQGLTEADETAIRSALAGVAPSVVRIDTVGGLDVVGGPSKKGGPGGIRKGTGPTTGLIVSADGYVVTSSFNFANNPSELYVYVPGHKDKYVGKVVARDHARLLTLIRLEPIDGKAFTDLPVPKAAAKADFRVGQWAVAVGRTLDPNPDHPPAPAVGIVSATDRIWGKMVQTDAKVSPANYGGPLVGIDGRVLGVIVPASIEGEDETAGFRYYDSGIGFAVPLEDIFARLPALKAGTNLKRGLFGVTPKGTIEHAGPLVVETVLPESAADKAGVKPGDTVVSINGKPVPHFSALKYVLGPMYEGDTISVKIRRGDAEMEFKDIVLPGVATAYARPYLGLLPIRDDAPGGVEVRYVYPKGPADAAGIKAGDRITRVGTEERMSPTPTREALTTAVAALRVGAEAKVEVKRKDGGKTETVTAKLTATPDVLPETLPLPSSAGKAGEEKKKADDLLFPPGAMRLSVGREYVAFQEKKADDKKVETGFLKRTNPTLGRDYWVFVPPNYTPKVSHGLLVWLHPAGQGGKDGEKVAEAFGAFAADHHFILLGPTAKDADGWSPAEADAVVTDLTTVAGQYTIDKSRVVAHGMADGGRMAYHLGFQARDWVRGVAAVGAELGTAPKDTAADKPLAFFVAVGDKDPLVKDVTAGCDALTAKRYPVTLRKMPEVGKEYLDEPAFADLLRWLDSLDHI